MCNRYRIRVIAKQINLGLENRNKEHWHVKR